MARAHKVNLQSTRSSSDEDSYSSSSSKHMCTQQYTGQCADNSPTFLFREDDKATPSTVFPLVRLTFALSKKSNDAIKSTSAGTDVAPAAGSSARGDSSQLLLSPNTSPGGDFEFVSLPNHSSPWRSGDTTTNAGDLTLIRVPWALRFEWCLSITAGSLRASRSRLHRVPKRDTPVLLCSTAGAVHSAQHDLLKLSFMTVFSDSLFSERAADKATEPRTTLNRETLLDINMLLPNQPFLLGVRQDVENSRAVGCTKGASYGTSGSNRVELCFGLAKDGMVDVLSQK